MANQKVIKDDNLSKFVQMAVSCKFLHFDLTQYSIVPPLHSPAELQGCEGSSRGRRLICHSQGVNQESIHGKLHCHSHCSFIPDLVCAYLVVVQCKVEPLREVQTYHRICSTPISLFLVSLVLIDFFPVPQSSSYGSFHSIIRFLKHVSLNGNRLCYGL